MPPSSPTLAAAGPRRPSLLFRIARVLLIGIALLAAAVVLRFIAVTRDRFPGYSVELALDGRSATQSPRPLRVGFGEVDITPDISDPKRPVWMAGFSQNRSATNIHDPLAASALVLDNGHARVGIVAIDSIGFFHDDVIRVRQAIPADWKLDYVVVCSTHNHSTPDLMGLWGPSPLQSGVDPAYKLQVIHGARDALGLAIIYRG